MKYHIYIIFLLVVSVISCGRPAIHDSSPVENIKDETRFVEMSEKIASGDYTLSDCKAVWNYFLKRSRYAELRSHAEGVLSSDISDEIYVNALYYLALSSMFMEDYEGAENYISQTFAEIEERGVKDISLIGKINEVAGIFTLKKDSNYAKALYYFTESYSCFEEVGDTLNICVNLVNITEMSLLREDVSGMDYAMKAYELSSGTGLESIAASKLALMYLLAGNVDDALDMSESAVAKMHEAGTPVSMFTTIYASYADILSFAGRSDEARYYYGEAYRYLSDSDVRTVIRYYVSYAEFLSSEENFSEAVEVYGQAESLAIKYSNREFNHIIYLGIAQSYDRMGETLKAINYYKMYVEAYDSIINFNAEQELQGMKLRYEKENFLLRIEKERSKITFLVIIVMIVAFTSFYVFMLYRRQNILYKNIVRRYNDYRTEIKKMKEVEEFRKNTQMKSMTAMYDKLEKLMQQDHLYRKADLTLQSISEILGSNTSYVSNMINRFSGKTFPNYINSYRIREVVESLSGSDTGMSVKDIFINAGFNTPATAYRVFQKEVGCTPNQYRSQTGVTKD